MTIFALCSAVILITCSVLTYLYSGKTDLEKQTEWRISGIYTMITILAAITVRVFQQVRPEDLALGAVLKLTASLPAVLYAFRGYQLHKTRFGLYILLAICTGLAADMTININFLAGGAIFLAGHALFDAAFLHEKKPSGKQVLLWLGLTALMIIPLYIFREKLGSCSMESEPWLISRS